MQLKLVRGFPEPVAKLGRQLNKLLLEKALRCLPHSPFFYLMTSSSFQKFKILGIVLHYQGSGLRKDRIRKKRKWRMLLLFILAVFTVAVFAILFFFHTRNVYLHLKKPTDDNTACLYVLLKVLAFSETQISLRLILTDCSRTKPAKKLIFG